MKVTVFCRIIALVVLVVFTFTSCNFYISPVPDTFSVPIGKGDIRYVFLDENYQPTIHDVGKMAMYVENNEQAKDVLIISEITGNNIGNDVVVRVINGQNDSFASFFFHSGQKFPYKIAMTMDGEDVVGIFSMYNDFDQTYSVEFTYETEETDVFTDLILNNEIFTQFKWSDELTETQNTRAQCIVTTLALWTSIALQINDDFDVTGRALKWKDIKKVLKGFFIAVAVVAVLVVLAPVAPAAIAVAGATVTISLTTTTQIVAAAVAVAATAAAVFIDKIPDVITKDKDDSSDSGGGIHITPDPNPNRPPMIEITYADSGKKVPNRKTPPEYIEPGEEITYNIKITDVGARGDKTGIIYEGDEEYISPFDSTNTLIGWDIGNAVFFERPIISGDINNVVQITIKRKELAGFFGDGIVQFAISFKQDVIINDFSDGIDFIIYNSGHSYTSGISKHAFILNFTVIKVP